MAGSGGGEEVGEGEEGEEGAGEDEEEGGEERAVEPRALMRWSMARLQIDYQCTRGRCISSFDITVL